MVCNVRRAIIAFDMANSITHLMSSAFTVKVICARGCCRLERVSHVCVCIRVARETRIVWLKATSISDTRPTATTTPHSSSTVCYSFSLRSSLYWFIPFPIQTTPTVSLIDFFLSQGKTKRSKYICGAIYFDVEKILVHDQLISRYIGNFTV